MKAFGVWNDGQNRKTKKMGAENESFFKGGTVCPERYFTVEYEVSPGIPIIYYTSRTQNGVWCRAEENSRDVFEIQVNLLWLLELLKG